MLLISKIKCITEQCHSSHSSSWQITSPYREGVWSVLRVSPIHLSALSSCITKTVILQDHLSKPYRKWTIRVCHSPRSLGIVCTPNLTTRNIAWKYLHRLSINNFWAFIYLLFLHTVKYHQSPLCPPSSTGSATNNSFSWIADFRLTADQPAPISLVHAATSRRINLFSPTCHIACIPVRCREAAAMETQEPIEKLDVQNIPIPSNPYETRAR